MVCGRVEQSTHTGVCNQTGNGRVLVKGKQNTHRRGGRQSLFIMGEDRVTSAEKKNGDVLLPPRQRHSSIISSCSEDVESETTSTGYPPTPDEEKEEELEYGPGIVNKLRTRFLSITLKQRGCNMRRSCSMENLLDQTDRPSRINIFSQNATSEVDKHSEEQKNPVWGNLKRAKSMDTLLMDLQQQQQLQQSESSPVSLDSQLNGDMKKEPKIVRRRDRTGPTICDEELPKPDTVKTYKRMFEPAESRRGSYSRRPPVLRASAKSGSLSVSKTNGVSSSAKVNGTVSKSKLSAKQSPILKKAQSDAEVTPKSNSSVVSEPQVNGDDTKPVCNGSFVKATPVKITDSSQCNGKIEKTVVKEVNGSSVCKKEVLSNQKNGVICNGNSPHKELNKTEKKSEDYVKPDVKKLVNQTLKVLNGNDKQVTNVLNGLKTKPKVPPNRPAFIKNVKLSSKIAEMNGSEKRAPLIPKLKPTSNTIHRKIQDVAKPEVNSKIEEVVPSEPRLNGVANKEAKNREVITPKEADDKKIVEENNRRNAEKAVLEQKESNNVEKTNFIPKKESEEEVFNHINGETAEETEKVTNNQKPAIESPVVDLSKSESKSVKKQQSSEPITTSMVFDFRGKDVVPHVAVLPVPFGCKALHPKKTILIEGKEVLNGNSVPSDDDDEYHMDYSVPPPSGVTFEGENVKIGKGSILSIRNKDLKIKFDDSVEENTFVYPSESSLLEDSEQSLTPSPPPSEVIPNGQPPQNKLKSNTSIGSSGAGGLSTYTPSVLRTMDNFEPGMFRPPPCPEKEDDKSAVQSGEEENTAVRREDSKEQEMLKPADPGLISSWSLSAGTSDLLF